MTTRYEHWKKSNPFYQRRTMSHGKCTHGYERHHGFIVTNAAYSDPEDYTTTDEDCEDTSDWTYKYERQVSKDSLADDMDLDFMMPSRVREILRSEGITDNVIDNSLRQGEKKYRMALFLTVQQQKYQKASAESKRQTPKSVALPKISTLEKQPKYDESSHTPGCECCHDVTVRRERRHTRPKPWCERVPSPTIDVNPTEDTIEIAEHTMEDEFKFCLTDAEKIKWLSEQQYEKAMVGSNFDPPRLVLISSKISKINLLQKILLPNAVIIVYDFDVASFNDILEQISNKLESIKSGCKAKSILLFCQGGPGYLYILRKVAVTPQKMKKDSYKVVREFWKTLSSYVSKINQEDAAIHITGCGLGESFQGREVVRFIQRLVQNYMVRIYAHDDQSEKGQRFIQLYFNKIWFNIWKAHLDDSDDELDFELFENPRVSIASAESECEIRTWSSLAAQLDHDPENTTENIPV